ncbi:MAG: WS/DGAT/MGAT family O-acyltransferase [Actinomycetota bacterium]
MAERLSGMDASFLYLETPGVHMHVGGLAVLDPSVRPDGRLRFEVLEQLVAQRIHLVPRFRQRVQFPALPVGKPAWVDDERFDLSFHLRRATLGPPGGRRELAELVGRVMSRPLDRSRPLWELHFIEGLEGGHVAVLAKSHHALIDGISGMDLASVLFDFTPEPQELTPPPWHPAREPATGELLVRSAADQVARPLQAIGLGVKRLRRAPEEALEITRRTLTGLSSLVSAGPTPPGPFNLPVGPNRRFAMAEVEVDDARAVKNALGGTVNDVVLATVAGALHRFLRGRGEKTSGATLRALVPVSIRDRSQRMALGNQVSMFFVDLPVGRMSAAGRLRRVAEATRELKYRHQAVAASALIGLGTWAPPTLHALSARLVARQRVANLVVSNVPGPQVPLYLAGARQVATYPVMPLGPTMGLSIAVTSLSGVMGFGLTSDREAVPDLEDLAGNLLESFEELAKAARR